MVRLATILATAHLEVRVRREYPELGRTEDFEVLRELELVQKICLYAWLKVKTN